MSESRPIESRLNGSSEATGDPAGSAAASTFEFHERPFVPSEHPFEPWKAYEPLRDESMGSVQRLLLRYVHHPQQRQVLEQLIGDGVRGNSELPLEAFTPIHHAASVERVARGEGALKIHGPASRVFVEKVGDRLQNVANWLLGRLPRELLIDGGADLYTLVLFEDAEVDTVSLGPAWGHPSHADPEGNRYLHFNQESTFAAAYWQSTMFSTVQELGLVHEPITDRYAWVVASTSDYPCYTMLEVVSGKLGRSFSHRRRKVEEHFSSLFQIDGCGWEAGQPDSVWSSLLDDETQQRIFLGEDPVGGGLRVHKEMACLEPIIKAVIESDAGAECPLDADGILKLAYHVRLNRLQGLSIDLPDDPADFWDPNEFIKPLDTHPTKHPRLDSAWKKAADASLRSWLATHYPHRTPSGFQDS
ncbi:MAG: hypothetical protein GY911_06590 [Actinomycetales bacterium]|nr:hypothetical protein [Actinomycetales bacterium]